MGEEASGALQDRLLGGPGLPAEEVARYGLLKYGVAEVIHAVTNGGLDDEHYEPFLGAIAVLLEAGAIEGTLKPEIDPEDVLLQLSVLWRILPGAGSGSRAARILDLIIDGLRTRPRRGTVMSRRRRLEPRDDA